MNKIGKQHARNIARAGADFSSRCDTPTLSHRPASTKLPPGSEARRIADSSDVPQSPVFERDKPVEAAGEIEIMRRDQCGEPGMADEIEERVEHAVAGRVVE